MPFCLHRPPVTPLDPILSMYAHATARRTERKILGEDQRVPFTTPLRAWTVNAAHLFGETGEGSIREGHLADLVILSQNPLETAP